MTSARPSQPSSDIDDLLLKVEVTMQRIVRGGRIDRLSTMALEQLATGGRRFRARLALMACQVLDVDEQDAIRWAAAMELLHNATLVHDDIQDEDTTRRGRPTLWVKHGRAQAINAGDLLLMLPLLVVEEIQAAVGPELAFALAKTATQIVRGQSSEMGLRASQRFDWESYLSAARGKTGALLALPVWGALRLAGRSEEQARAVSNIYEGVGVLFQLQDDLVDLFGDKGRGEVGCDIYEGKISALVVAQLERDPQSRTAVLDILDRPRRATTPGDVRSLISLFEQSGARDQVVSRICDLRAGILSAQALAKEPALRSITERVIARTLAPVAHLLPSRGSSPCHGGRPAGRVSA